MAILKWYLHFIREDAQKDLRKSVLYMVDAHSGGTLLDCGCDDGTFTRLVSEKIGASKVLGIEVNRHRAAMTRDQHIRVYETDLNQRFPIADESIDLVIAVQTIEHLINLDTFVSELYRVLKRGGHLIISTDNLASWHNIFALILGNQPYCGPQLSRKYTIRYYPVDGSLEELYEKKPHMASMPEHVKVMTTRALKRLLEAYGFEVLRVKGSGYYPFFSSVASALAWLDRYHATNVVVKARRAR